MAGAKPRRLVIRDTNGELLAADALGHPLAHWQIDLTGIPNANSRATMTAVVQEHCNLGCWHDSAKLQLPCWGSD
jgi:hypothetical protein